MTKGYDFRKAKRGPVVAVPKGKTRITIRLDEDVLQWFKDQVHDAAIAKVEALGLRVLAERLEHHEAVPATGGAARRAPLDPHVT